MSQKGNMLRALETVGDHPCLTCSGAVALRRGEEGVLGPGSQKAGDTAPSLLLIALPCTRGLHFWKDGMLVDDTLAL